MPTTTAPPILMTAEEFVAQHENDRMELVNGVVVELPMPTLAHGTVCFQFAVELGVYLKTNDIGRGADNDSFVKTKPDSVRGADVLYYSYERLPRGPVPHGLLDVAPDLVVEVRSPSDRLSKMTEKAMEYLAAGVRAVILLDPERSAATVFREEELPQTFHNGDTLTVPEILPGFEVKLAKLFS